MTWAATSAMWTQIRKPSPSGFAETASSKSRALAGSTVKVGSAVRSRRAPASRCERRDRAARLLLVAIPEGRTQAAIGDQRPDDVTGVVGAAEVDDRLAAAPIDPAERDPARLDLDAPAGEAHLRAALEQRLADPEAARGERPRAPGGARIGGVGHHLPSQLGGDLIEAGVEHVVAVARVLVLDALVGDDALAEDRRPVGGQVLADGQVERAAGFERDHLLEDALAVGAGADHGREVVLLERGGDDLRGRGGVAVDQYGDRADAGRARSPVASNVCSSRVRPSIVTTGPSS